MERLHNGFTLKLCPGAFPLSTDSIALAHFARLPRNARVLDLCSGCGTLGLYLCALDDTCEVTGVEIDNGAHNAALLNAEDNGIPHRLNSLCAPIQNIPEIFSPGQFSVCISNPPYFSAGPQSEKNPVARREDLCPLPDLFRSASWALQYGGDFYLVHRPERLSELCALGAANNLEAKRILLLRHKEGGPIAMILLQFRKGGKPGLIWEEEFLFHANGSQSGYYRKLYHI